MNLDTLLKKFNNHMNNPGIENTTLIDWVNEFIDYIAYDCNVLPVKSQDYVVTDVTDLAVLPTDYRNMITWYIGNNTYNGIRIREDGKLIFPYTGTFTLIYNAKVTYADSSMATDELPVDEPLHTLFFDYLKGKFYSDDGEGDESTQYGQILLNTAKSEVTRITSSKQGNTPVVPKMSQKWSRSYRGGDYINDEE